MITMWQMYLLTRLDEVTCGLVVTMVLAGICIVLSILFWGLEGEFEKENFPKTIKPFSIVFGISLFLAVLIPDSKTMALIYVVPKIVNNQKIQAIPDKLLDLANKKLDEWIEDKK